MNTPRVTIVLLIKNNADILDRLLTAIFDQEVNYRFEVLIIDSGSFDGSLGILKRFKYKLSKHFTRRTLRVHQISPIDFGFGKTRNKAVQLARGDVIVFLSTRVVPSDKRWLLNLVDSLSPFTKVCSGTVAAFGKVVPSRTLGFSEALRFKTFYGYSPRLITGKSFNGPFGLLFSDINCAIFTCTLKKFPFSEDIIVGEDQIWAQKILQNELSISYNPKSSVIYLQGHTFSELFKHYYTKGYTLTKSLSYSWITIITSWAQYFKYEMRYLLKKQYIKLLFKEVFSEIGRLLGFFLGRFADRLPTSFKRKFLLYGRGVR